MPRYLKFELRTPERRLVRGYDGFRFRVDILEAEGIPPEIFGYQRVLMDPASGSTIDEFLFVCSPYDLTIYPANAPRLDQFPAFFRKPFVDLVLPTLSLFENTWSLLRRDICNLLDGLERLDRLSVRDVRYCGTPSPDEPSSESLSEPSP